MLKIDLVFVLTAALLGVGLAMDAFSVSVADGLSEPNMKKRKVLLISGVFAAFQAAMPLAGWFVVHSAVGAFKFFEPIIPYIALALLSFIGGETRYNTLQNIETVGVYKKRITGAVTITVSTYLLKTFID